MHARYRMCKNPRHLICKFTVHDPGIQQEPLLLQTRVRTLNGELAGIFKRWYPDLDIKGGEIPIAA